ncbi:MAG: hypothetical protein NQU46_02150 [Methanolinea sp.]|nr:hypothetical protein [Methanolinea sp.]
MLFTLVLFTIFLTHASAVTVFVNVYEREGNVTPLSGASLYADGTFIGKSDTEGNIQFSHPGQGPVGITVKKLGYSTWNGDIGPNTTSLSVEMKRARVQLTVETYDTDTLLPVPMATVRVTGPGLANSTSTDSNGSAVFSLEANSAYTLDIDAPGYRDYAREVEVGLEDRKVQVLLVRDERFSLIARDAASGEPVSGARVSVNGMERGVTDQRGALIVSLPQGRVYAVEVSREGYDEYRGQQLVEEGQAIVTIPLRRSTAVVFVTVYNEENDAVGGAAVALDGTVVGHTNQYGRLPVHNLTYGQYVLEVTAPGFVPNRQEVRVSSQAEDIPVELAYQRVNLTVLTVEGGSAPVPGALILVNGTAAGTTDAGGRLDITLRPAVPHLLTATKDGFLPATATLIPAPSNGSSPIRIPMERSIDWVFIGIIGAVVAGGCTGAYFLLARRRGRSVHGRKGGL